MAQADQIIQNDTGQNVRSDINSNLAALYSLSSGSSEPSTTTAHQLWLDTSTNPDTLKIRNSSDNGWILIGDVSTNLGMALLTGATFSGNVLIAAGAVGSAGLGFSGDTDTGLYKVAANDLGITAGGSLIAHLNSSGLEIEDGKQLRLRDSGGSNIVSLAAPALTSDVALTLPTSDGNNGDFLQSNGSGVLSWAAVAGVPSGSVFTHASTTLPAGYLECNGASVSRTTYASLFTAIGTTWGSADGSTFNVPDLRGEFVRGFDNGRGVDSGRSFASSQAENFKSHDHDVTDPGHSHSGDVEAARHTGGTMGRGDTYGLVNNSTRTLSIDSADTDLTVDSEGGSETRPRNISMMYIIKT